MEKAKYIKPIKQHILVYGLELECPSIVVNDSVRLNKLLQPLTVSDLAGAGQAGFRGWTAIAPFASGCKCEIESLEAAEVNPISDGISNAFLLSCALNLMDYSSHVPLASSNYSWNTIAGHRKEGDDNPPKLPDFTGQLVDYYINVMVPKGSLNKISENDISWLQTHFDSLSAIVRQSDPFRFALEASIDWRYAKNIRSAIARLWSGIEALYGLHTELVYRISFYSASLLAQRGEARIEKFKQVKNLYGKRSKAVHGGKLSDEALVQAANDSFRLLRDLLKRSIEIGHALTEDDLNEAMFG